jgi:hypothetical protein
MIIQTTVYTSTDTLEVLISVKIVRDTVLIIFISYKIHNFKDKKNHDCWFLSFKTILNLSRHYRSFNTNFEKSQD